MRVKRAFSVLLFSLSMMIMIVTALRDHVATPVQGEIQAEGTYSAANDNAPRLSPERSLHILYGDQTGGGHLYGVSAPCKSEFPASWTAEEIIATVKKLAANDNVSWRQQENGYYTSEQMVEGVKIRVVLDREGDDIITAYPVNLKRNACPGGG